MGGFEGADHVNGQGTALDMARLSGHWQRLDEDHRRARDAGLRVVRESIGWRLCEAPGGRIDLTRALRIAESAERHGLQVLWTVMHYGLPADLSLHDDALVARLPRFAAACAKALGPAVYTPVNEIGFLAWCASQPGLFAPPNAAPAGDLQHSQISGWAVKQRLARAAIAAVHAMRAEQPAARFLHVEPVVHVVAPDDARAAEARQIASWQWQAWDLLAASPGVLDLVGINHYHSSQWELGSEARLDWWGRDARRKPFAALLAEAFARYGRPLVVAETSHVGLGRDAWLHEMAHEVRTAQRTGVPVLGLCLYPLTDRPDWNQPAHWHRSGLWHVDAASGARHAEPVCKAALHDWQNEWTSAPRGDVLVIFSHLRWRAMRHRTRHLAEGLAARGWRIVFVEEGRPGAPRLDRIPAGPHLDVLVPHGPDGGAGIAAWLAAEGITRFTAWLTTPMAWPQARALAPERVVYDCADELAGFLHALPALPRLEAELMAAADLVLAAGRSLATPRAAQGRRLRVLPNAVDLRHFGRRLRGGWDHDEAALLQPPGAVRIGYAGAVDERLDLALVAALADARPQWTFVFAGPVLKIDPAALPRRANLHWLGEVPYRLLPELMAGWQAVVVPFVRSAATRHAQPLKVLEALAAGLPVVAPTLPELLRWRDAGVRCASSPSAFLRACDDALAHPGVPAVARRRLAAWTWDHAAARVDAWLRAPAAQLRATSAA